MTTPRVWDPKTSSWVAFQGPQGVQGAQGPRGAQGRLGAIGSIGPGNAVIASTGYLAISQASTEVLNNNANGNAAGWYRISGYCQYGYTGGPGVTGVSLSVTVTDDTGANNTYWPAVMLYSGQILAFTNGWGGSGGGGSMNQFFEVFPLVVHQPVAGAANRVAVSARYYTQATSGNAHVYLLLEQLTTS